MSLYPPTNSSMTRVVILSGSTQIVSLTVVYDNSRTGVTGVRKDTVSALGVD